MTRARILTTAGVIHLTVATLLALTFLFGQPNSAMSSGLGFTPTPTVPTPTDTPTIAVTETPTRTPPPPPRPDLTITKTASPAEVLPGGQVTIVIEVCNEGDATAEDVVVSDALPPELEVVSASASQGRAVVVGNGVRAEFGDLPPGACATLTIVARVRADVPPCTRIGNVATIGDLVSNRVTIHVVGFLPESGVPAVLAVIVALLVVGGILLATGVTLQVRKRVTTSE
jgi:uncharacterized repeat protein (TIGR01451 family)